MSSFKHLLAWDYASHWRKVVVWVEERVVPFSDCFLLFHLVFFLFFPTAESGPSLNIGVEFLICHTMTLYHVSNLLCRHFYHPINKVLFHSL